MMAAPSSFLLAQKPYKLIKAKRENFCRSVLFGLPALRVLPRERGVLWSFFGLLSCALFSFSFICVLSGEITPFWREIIPLSGGNNPSIGGK